MKKYLVLVLSLMCVSCADLNAQMAGLTKAMNGDSNQQSQSATAPNKVNNQSPQKNSSPSKSGNVNNVANESGSLNLKEAQVALDCGILIVGAKDDRLGVYQRTGATLPVKVLNYDAAKKVYEFNILGAPSFGPKLADSYKLNVNNKTLESVYNQPSNEPRPPRISNCNSLKTQNTQAPKDDRASVPDWVSKMKQDMEDSKSPKQKEFEADRQKEKNLISESDFVFRCSPPASMPVQIYSTKSGIKFYDVFGKDVAGNYQNIQVKGGVIYFESKPLDTGAVNLKTKYALDTANGNLAQLTDVANSFTGKQDRTAQEVTCKKLK